MQSRRVAGGFSGLFCFSDSSNIMSGKLVRQKEEPLLKISIKYSKKYPLHHFVFVVQCYAFELQS